MAFKFGKRETCKVYIVLDRRNPAVLPLRFRKVMCAYFFYRVSLRDVSPTPKSNQPGGRAAANSKNEGGDIKYVLTTYYYIMNTRMY